MKWSESHSVVPDSLRPCGLYSPWNSPGQSTGVGGLSLLQGIFATQGWKPGLLHCRQILYCLSHKGSPRILGWVAYPFSSGYSWPRNWTRVFCIAGGFFPNWAMRKATVTQSSVNKHVCALSRVWLLETPWAVARQTPLSMGIFKQDYWSGLPFLSPGDHPDLGTKPRSPALQAGSLLTKPIVIPKFTYRFSFNQSPEINPCTYGQLICDKEARRYNVGKTASSTNGVEKTG